MIKSSRSVRYVLLAVLLILTRGFVRASEPPQQPSTEEPSLGERARELKAQQAQQSKPARVFTNDDLKNGSGTINVIGVGASTDTSEGSAAEHNEHYYRKTMSELQAKLDIDQRQLAVLQQELGINQVQYYPDPSKTLQQEYSRSDINKLQEEIEAKQQEIKADEDAISDLRAQLQREGGDPGWLRVSPGEQSSLSKLESVGADHPKGKLGTKEYWESRFKSARAKLARAREIQQLTEDELRLLQVQQAREVLNTDVAAELAQKIPAKQAEVDAARAATEKATQELEELQKEFAASGAPEEWSAEQ
jgi:ribosomal protein L19E